MSDSHAHAGFVAPDPSDLAPLFPGYEIQSLIATGGMGAVYCAVQKSLDRTVALKILPMEFSKDAAFCAGFEAEAKAMARLNHPNLIGVYDFGEVNGMLYIIMEYVPGKSIYHSAYGKAIDPQEAIRLVTGICHGLAHAHDNGILHRDIKPSNILLDLNAEPKIGDFGLARPLGSKVEEGEEIFGTPHYTAPEVVDNPHAVDYRADLFSVGVLLHELLTSRLPADDPRPASSIVRCDPRFDAIIRKATQPLPAARYTSASEIAKDLQAIASSHVPQVQRGAAVPVRRGSPRARVHGRHATKQQSGGGMLVILLLAAAGAAAYYYYSNKPAEKEPEPKVVILPPRDNKPKPGVGTAGNHNPTDTRIPPTSHDATDSNQQKEGPSSSIPDRTADHSTLPDAGPNKTRPQPSAPKADVNAFFRRAHDIMREKAAAPISARKLGIEENYSGFETAMKRRILRYQSSKRPDDEVVEKALKKWQKYGGLLPEEIGYSLSKFPELEKIHEEYLLKQTGVLDTFDLALSKLSDLYIVGLKKQIERYQADGDSEAVRLVEKEIATTRAEPDHFATDVLGIAEVEQQQESYDDEEEEQTSPFGRDFRND